MVYVEEKMTFIFSYEYEREIEKTLYLHSIPGMEKSIREGLNIPIDETDEEPGW